MNRLRRRAGVIVLTAAMTGPPSAARAAPPTGGVPTPIAPLPSTPAPILAPLPDFLRTRPRMAARDLSEKREGGYWTGLPLFNADPDTGIGLGARVYYYWNGRREDPLYPFTPYLDRIFAQAFVTTNGAQLHVIDYDAPYVWHTRFRLRAALSYERNISANYYGRGSSTLSPLGFPGATRSYTRLDDYREALSRLQPDGTSYARYNKYDFRQPLARLAMERDLFGGAVRWFGGVIFSYVMLGDYTGVPTPAAAGLSGPEAPTLLHADCIGRRIVGCENGWDNQLKLGISYDTRDFEPDPTAGVVLGVTTEISSRRLGSRYNYERVTGAVRVFYSPLPALARLVLAARAAYSVQMGEVPFFDLGTLAFIDADQSGLGGLRTLRGFTQDRFVGRIAAVTNLEARWTFLTFTVRTQRARLFLAPFVDAGRVFDDVNGTTLTGWKIGKGVALRVGINQATIVSIDYGTSSEGTGLYVNFGQPF